VRELYLKEIHLVEDAETAPKPETVEEGKQDQVKMIKV